eukprot:GHRR01000317.1.p3 GENE.GHRR01000317.1~~GHRR01000317.1.p3  ORF type:complete len:122 (+),score=36.72 GHRR01000317.1:395-760(+)
MLYQTSRSATSLVSAAARSFCTSLRTMEGTPTYTYTSPGSSIKDPKYQQPDEAAANTLPDSKIMRPSKKAQWLKVTTRKMNSPLEPQQQPGAMLPPGCSISDPYYSVRDPVYFVDKSKPKQ